MSEREQSLSFHDKRTPHSSFAQLRIGKVETSQPSISSAKLEMNADVTEPGEVVSLGDENIGMVNRFSSDFLFNSGQFSLWLPETSLFYQDYKYLCIFLHMFVKCKCRTP